MKRQYKVMTALVTSFTLLLVFSAWQRPDKTRQQVSVQRDPNGKIAKFEELAKWQVANREEAQAKQEAFERARVDRFRSKDHRQLAADVEVFMNRDFSPENKVRFETSHKSEQIVLQSLDPVLPLTFHRLVEYTVLPVSKNREVPGRGEEVPPPSYLAEAYFKDQRGRLYSTLLMTDAENPERLRPGSRGAVLDVSSNGISAGENLADRHLTELPPILTQALSDGARIVSVPYPYAGDGTLYAMYGDDPATARFIDVQTGKEFTGISAILDWVDERWRSLK
jgi:hypothetical protein